MFLLGTVKCKLHPGTISGEKYEMCKTKLTMAIQLSERFG